MSGLQERIEWVLEHRAEVVKNKSQWALKAGLARQHVVKLIERNVEDGVEVGTLRKLAAAAGVSSAWLIEGVGAPDDTPPASDRYPNRAAAAQMARLAGLSEDAIAEVLSRQLQSDNDLPPLVWFDAMRQVDSMRKHGMTAPGRALEDDP